ncbi:MAG: pantoate--beta-alanine ligase [Elusimicrobiota bacterium]
MKLIKKISDMRQWSKDKALRSYSIGLVPTMGALHKAHGMLIEKAVKENDFSVVSIFVNPSQFGPGEDYESYPRDLKSDLSLCRDLGVDAVFNPYPKEMILKDELTSIRVGEITSYMCGEFRPGHFEAVATVVAKLFNIVCPDRAYFGLKDYQQLRVIEKMNEDLKMGVDIVPLPTLREENGLAVSSRNSYLGERERKEAGFIYKALLRGKRMAEEGERDGSKISREVWEYIKKNIPKAEIDYAGIFHSGKLYPIKEIKDSFVIAAAVKMNRARLIDNIPVNLK